jgi:heme a synthase
VTSLPEDARRVALRAGRAAAALTAAAWVLIVIGALVRAHGAGLSCPDWPLCHGRVVPDFDARIALEWGHRLFAGTLGVGVLGVAALLLRRGELRARFGKSLALVFALLGTQIVLGGLTVLLGLAPWTVTAHLVTGNAFALSLAWLARDAFDAARETPRPRPSLSPASARLVWATAGLVALQVVLGGLVSSHYAGLACSTFPLCNGDSLAPAFTGPIGLQVLHRMNACAVAAAYLVLAWRTQGLAREGVALVFLQIIVGAADVLLRLPVEVTALHSALAAGIVLATGLLVRDARRSRVASQEVTRAAERHALGAAR